MYTITVDGITHEVTEKESWKTMKHLFGPELFKRCKQKLEDATEKGLEIGREDFTFQRKITTQDGY